MMFNFADGDTTSVIIRSISMAERYGVSNELESTRASDGLSPRSDGVMDTLSFITALKAVCFS